MHHHARIGPYASSAGYDEMPTWIHTGQHLAAALAKVPADERVSGLMSAQAASYLRYFDRLDTQCDTVFAQLQPMAQAFNVTRMTCLANLAAFVGGGLRALELHDAHSEEIKTVFRQRYPLQSRADALLGYTPEDAAVRTYLRDLADDVAPKPRLPDIGSIHFERSILMPTVRAYIGGGMRGALCASRILSMRHAGSTHSILALSYMPQSLARRAQQVDAWVQRDERDYAISAPETTSYEPSHPSFVLSPPTTHAQSALAHRVHVATPFPQSPGAVWDLSASPETDLVTFSWGD